MEAHDAAEMVLNCLEIVSFHKLNDVMVMNKRNFSRIGIDRGSIPFRRIHPSDLWIRKKVPPLFSPPRVGSVYPSNLVTD